MVRLFVRFGLGPRRITCTDEAPHQVTPARSSGRAAEVTPFLDALVGTRLVMETEPVNTRRRSSLIALALLVGSAGPCLAACDTCVIQTKEPSTKTPGEFDYRLACIELESGDELLWFVTAPSDEAAMAKGVDACGPWRT